MPQAPDRLARVPFILVLIALFAFGMTGLLMLNTTLQNQAFEARTLSRQATDLAYGQADLESRINRVAAPQELARRASALGLRANPHPAFLVLPEGRIVGRPEPVTGNEVPFMVVKTPAQLAAEQAAAKIRASQLAAQKVADEKAKAIEAAKVKKALDASRAAQARTLAQAKKAVLPTAANKTPQPTKAQATKTGRR